VSWAVSGGGKNSANAYFSWWLFLFPGVDGSGSGRGEVFHVAHSGGCDHADGEIVGNEDKCSAPASTSATSWQGRRREAPPSGSASAVQNRPTPRRRLLAILVAGFVAYSSKHTAAMQQRRESHVESSLSFRDCIISIGRHERRNESLSPFPTGHGQPVFMA
jgi:hypothetical protein